MSASSASLGYMRPHLYVIKTDSRPIYSWIFGVNVMFLSVWYVVCLMSVSPRCDKGIIISPSLPRRDPMGWKMIPVTSHHHGRPPSPLPRPSSLRLPHRIPGRSHRALRAINWSPVNIGIARACAYQSADTDSNLTFKHNSLTYWAETNSLSFWLCQEQFKYIAYVA